MKNLGFYRILTYILFAIGGFMALMLLTMIMAAMANPILLLPVFLVACVVMYTYSSWRFLTRGIDAHLYCKPALRDLIKVNGYGTIAFAGLVGVQSLSLIMNPAMLNEITEQAMEMQKASVEGMETLMLSFMHYLLRFLLVYSILLLVHVYISFRLIQQHADAFQIPPDPEG
ncbi:hypothetical protein [Flavihumibacter fluvii]|uniref:hypothetical protein n=1 Tax=Flavihumibacter fluvii TaxID=2838157 RepID=UPI001BDDFA14|nr:hypothetical protein [Flavihumibacter fluvii]ULQ52805.1 hypothetical protein KJS93_00530 [Flavihumibacter fluvii]